MTDQQLIELAAKAINLTGRWEEGHGLHVPRKSSTPQKGSGFEKSRGLPA